MKDKIIEAALKLTKDKGCRFTMDELARELGMSKKTIYTFYDKKDELLYDMTAITLDDIRKRQLEIISDKSIPCEKRLKKVFSELPPTEMNMDYSQLIYIHDKYPKVYKHIMKKVDEEWENTTELLYEGMEKGIFKPIDPMLIQISYQATIERLSYGDELKTMKLSYQEAVERFADLLVEGIMVH